MAIPRVFISSTWYDLKYIRENLRYFVRTLGYEPVLSEDGSVFYNPNLHTHDACLTEIPTCQLFVLIIGGRFGGEFHGTDQSVTNHEYHEAVKQKIPVFALVESAVYNEHHVYIKNKGNTKIDLANFNFPAVDSPRIFDFIDEVRSSTVNNALVSFRDFGDIETYLRSQWSGMMYEFLASRNQERRVADTLATLTQMNNRIEMLSKQILLSVGTEDAKLDAALFSELLASEAIRDLAYWKRRPTPADVLKYETWDACAEALAGKFTVTEDQGYSITGDSQISRLEFEHDLEEYQELRKRLTSILARFGKTPEVYIATHPKEIPELTPQVVASDPAPSPSSS